MWVAMQVVVFGYKKNSKYKMYLLFLVGILGLEPRMTGPESVVLPLHHIPILLLATCFLIASAKVRIIFELQTFSRFFFAKKLFFS